MGSRAGTCLALQELSLVVEYRVVRGIQQDQDNPMQGKIKCNGNRLVRVPPFQYQMAC